MSLVSRRIFILSVPKESSENSSPECLFVQNRLVKQGEEGNKEGKLMDFGSCLAFMFLSMRKEKTLCRHCSQRGSQPVLRVGPRRTTNRSPSSPGENFARG